MEGFEHHVESTGVLADDLRRALYLFIRGQRRPVGREEAAGAMGISRTLAAFHLDKLVEKGVLEARYARLTGRSGPGAGRPAKVYEPSACEIAVSIPFRSYEVVGDILLDALEDSVTSKSSASIEAAARDRGVEAARAKRAERRGRAENEKAVLRLVHHVLEQRGYEPYGDEGGGIRLHNCPFHALARRSPELVCGINRSFLDGVLQGLGVAHLEAVLEPRPGECCVHLRPKGAVA